MRAVKTFGPDNAPGQEIGAGIFDYSITVWYPDTTIVVRGSKGKEVT